MKRIFLVSSISFFLIIFIAHVSALTCSVIPISNTCSGTTIFKISATSNAQAEKADKNDYDSFGYQICCIQPGITLGTSCSGFNVVLRLSGIANAHVEKNTGNNPAYNGNDLCLSASSGDGLCNYANDCSTLGTDYTCLASISDNTNAHVGNCDAYANKVCCKVTTTTSCSYTTKQTCEADTNCAWLQVSTDPAGLDTPRTTGCYAKNSWAPVEAGNTTDKYVYDWCLDVNCGYPPQFANNGRNVWMDASHTMTAKYKSMTSTTSTSTTTTRTTTSTTIPQPISCSYYNDKQCKLCLLCAASLCGSECKWCNPTKTCWPLSEPSTSCSEPFIDYLPSCPEMIVTTSTTTIGSTTTTTGTTTSTTIPPGTYVLTIDTQVDKYGLPLSNVRVIVDNVIKYTSGTWPNVTFSLSPGTHTITVEDPFSSRPFTHFWDKDCDANNPNYWLDIANNPYTFQMFARNKNITAWYKIFTQIKDLNHDGNTITGKLLDENGNPLVELGGYHKTCTPETDSTQINVNRNVKLQYYDGSWHDIGIVDVSPTDNKSFSYPWSCVSGTTIIKTTYISNNWFYTTNSSEININCGGTTTTSSISTTSTTVGSTTTTTIGTCVIVGLGSPTITPSSPNANTQFNISCPVNNNNYDCLGAYSNDNTNECGFTPPWSGNNAIFSCSGLTAGSYAAKCVANAGTNSNCCADSKTTNYNVVSSGSHWPHISISAPASADVNQEFTVTLTYTHDTNETGGIHLRWEDSKFDIVDKGGCDNVYVDNPTFAPGWEGIECLVSNGTTKTFRLKCLQNGVQTFYYRAWDHSPDKSCGSWLDYSRDPNSGTCSSNCDIFPDDWEVCDANNRTINVGGVTTTTIAEEGSYDNPSTADCGKTKINQQTTNQYYYKVILSSDSNVTIKMFPSANVDYDLYVNWDETIPTFDSWSCRPSNDKGLAEECNSTSLPEGTYYIMVNYRQEYSQGTGTYNLSVKCSPKSCSNPDDPCKIDCGKSKTDRSTNTKDYFKFRLSSDSNVTIKMFPSANVDYDLYVNWDGTIPTIDHADCKPTVGTGLKEECKMPNQDISTFLGEGDYYIMVNHYDGAGTYDLVLSCPSVTTGTTTTTTTRITTSTIRSTTTTGVTTTSGTTTIGGVTTTTTEASCGIDGYCIDENNQCTESYEPCSSNNVDCGDNEKCCCPKGKGGPGYMMIIVGLLLTFVLIILVFFYFKGRSRMTYEKLYSKWSRILIEKPRI